MDTDTGTEAVVSPPDPRNYQEHFDSRYARYHIDVWMPDLVREASLGFLPPPLTPLTLSKHYTEWQESRHLPPKLHMPRNFQLIDVTLVRETAAVFRAMIRFPWFRRRKVAVTVTEPGHPRTERSPYDLVLVLEGDYEVVTAFWIRSSDRHETLDASLYEQLPSGQ